MKAPEKPVYQRPANMKAMNDPGTLTRLAALQRNKTTAINSIAEEELRNAANKEALKEAEQMAWAYDEERREKAARYGNV